MAAHDPSRPLETLDAAGQIRVIQSINERILGTLGLSSESDYKYDAFISYRRCEPDRTFAFDLVRKLEAAGFSIALDERDFSPQATFLEEMERCIKESRFTLAVCTPRYFQSGNTQEEAIICKVLDMNDRKRRLIPLILETTERPVWLYNIVGVDFTSNQAFIDPLEKLKQTLSRPQ
jgi:hypothetical protein